MTSVSTDIGGQDTSQAEPRTLTDWREQLLETLLRGMLVVGLFALVGGGIIPAIQHQRRDLLITYLVAYALIVLVTFVHRLGFTLRAGVLLFLLYILGALDFSVVGLSGDGRVFLLAFVVLTTVLFNLSHGVVALVLSLFTMAAAAWFLVTGRWEVPLQVQANATSVVDWVSGSAVLLLVSAGVIISVAYLVRSLGHSARASQDAVRELQAQRESLEALVKRRTRDLEHRSVQLQAAAEVARDATAARELDELLNRAVNLIRDRFGFYHAGIFLVDEPGEYAVLRAATGEAGQQMLEQGHRLRVGQEGIVGYVTGRGEPRIVLDVGADAVHFENPLLPETRSEMGLPLRLGERVIGALDVQSQEEAAFDADDAAVLQTMADQLAVAIENVRLLHEMQQTVRELEAAYGRHTQESWRAVAQTSRRPHGYRYRRLGVEPVVEPPEEARQAWLEGHPVTSTIQPEAGGDGQSGTSAVAVPIKFRDQVIGVFSLRSPTERMSPEAMSLIEEVADRLALALENARLLEETQRRAERDRLIANITSQVRSSMDPEIILQTAVRELGLALGADRTFVRLGTDRQPSET
jgi:GAF domain-containing protein